MRSTLLVLLAGYTSAALVSSQRNPLVARAARSRVSTAPVATALAPLDIVTDKEFETAVLSSSGPVVVDFFADYCGPCKLCEPSLVRLHNNADLDVTVVKARLDDNQKMRVWLAEHGGRITALPTLVLVKDGVPVSTMKGANMIVNSEALNKFATGSLDDAMPIVKEEKKPNDDLIGRVVRLLPGFNKVFA